MFRASIRTLEVVCNRTSVSRGRSLAVRGVGPSGCEAASGLRNPLLQLALAYASRWRRDEVGERSPPLRTALVAVLERRMAMAGKPCHCTAYRLWAPLLRLALDYASSRHDHSIHVALASLGSRRTLGSVPPRSSVDARRTARSGQPFHLHASCGRRTRWTLCGVRPQHLRSWKVGSSARDVCR